MESSHTIPEAVLERLLEGNARFVNGKSSHSHTSPERLEEVRAKQSPFAAIIACSDSRVPRG